MPNPPDEDKAIEALLALSYEVYPDPVDGFEDRLAALLGYRFILLAVAVASFGICFLFEVAVKMPLPLKVYLIMGVVSLALGSLALSKTR